MKRAAGLPAARWVQMDTFPVDQEMRAGVGPGLLRRRGGTRQPV